MSNPSNFRPAASAVFEPAMLAASAVSERNTVTRRYRLSSGTPVIHAAPENAEARARLVIVPSLRGHNAMFAELCTRLAELHGYEIISPELFPGRQYATEPERIEICKVMDDERVLADVRLAAAQLQPGPAIVAGFCLGGMFASKALASKLFVGAVSFYGFVRLPADWRRADRTEPLESVRNSEAPLLGFFGGNDPLISRADIEALREVASARIELFEEAGHAFAHDPLLPSYRREDAERAWQVACTFIDELSGRR